ncbi:MAG: hypothetical protein H5U22_01620 [Rhizobium sp.]|nr:hypothetical protein [Rhizobium sp.]
MSINGYGLFIYDHPQGRSCGFIDGSPVLRPDAIVASPGGRKIRFAEGNREVRTQGDIFVADPAIAEFVRVAINEKLARDAERPFFVSSVKYSRGVGILWAHVCIQYSDNGERETLAFTLEAPDLKTQDEGRQAFWEFAESIGAADMADVQTGMTGKRRAK